MAKRWKYRITKRRVEDVSAYCATCGQGFSRDSLMALAGQASIHARSSGHTVVVHGHVEYVYTGEANLAVAHRELREAS